MITDIGDSLPRKFHQAPPPTKAKLFIVHTKNLVPIYILSFEGVSDMPLQVEGAVLHVLCS